MTEKRENVVSSRKKAREDRLAAQLRENLKRRKAQAKARTKSDEDNSTKS